MRGSYGNHLSYKEADMFSLTDDHYLKVNKHGKYSKAGLYKFVLEAIPIINSSAPAFKDIDILLCD